MTIAPPAGGSTATPSSFGSRFGWPTGGRGGQRTLGEVAAFTETGRAPEIPAPLIRVPTGTIIKASIENRLTDSTIAIHGLLTHPAVGDDSLMLHPGESKEVTFAAGAPGTYLYYAVLGKHSSYRSRTTSGSNSPAPSSWIGGRLAPDRIFMINIWGSTIDSTSYQNALAINGRSWPYTERIQTTVGDSIRWRVINGSPARTPCTCTGSISGSMATEMGSGMRRRRLKNAPWPSPSRCSRSRR